MGMAVLVGTAIGLRVRLYDMQPSQSFQPAKADNLSSVSVCIFGVSTLSALKKISRSSVCSFDMATLIALLAGMIWSDKNPKDTCLFGFVVEKTPELIESSAVQSVTLVFFSPYPVANAVEFFESDPASGAFGQRYNAFRNNVIGVSRKALFFFTASF